MPTPLPPPKLPEDVARVLPQRMSDLITEAVAAHSQRDAELVQSYEQMMRLTVPTPNRPWRDSCDLIDPLTFEHFLSLFSTVRAARSQEPYWLMEAEKADDEQAAQAVEFALSSRAKRDGFPAALYDADWVALRDKCAPMFVGWCEKLKRVRSLRYRQLDPNVDPDSGLETEPDPNYLVPEDQKDPDHQYEEAPFAEPVVERRGIEFRVIDLANFYMCPPDAKDIDSAMGCGHREFYSSHELIAGIDAYGFDSDAVEELLRRGPTGQVVNGEYQQIKRDTAGTAAMDNEQNGGGVWEVFLWFGKLPLWMDAGEICIPKHLRDDEFTFILCPHHQIMLRFTYMEYDMRPYAQFKLLREPGGQGGESVATITGPHQEEATALLRLYMDSENIRAVPMFKALEANIREFPNNSKAGPGNVALCKNSLDEIEPMQWNMSGASDFPVLLNDVRGRARETVSGSGYGQLSPKVRKSAEVEAAVAGVSSKQNLFVSNLQESGMERTALLILSHIAKFEGSGPMDVYGRDQGVVTVQPEDWKRDYRINPRATADDANPSIRLQKRSAVLQAYAQSPFSQRDIAAGDYRPWFHLLRNFMQANDEKNTQAILGQEPPPPDYLQLAAQVMAQVYQATTDLPIDPKVFIGSPAMLVVLTALVQETDAAGEGSAPLMQAAQAAQAVAQQMQAQGGPQGMPQAGAGGPTRQSVSLNFKDAPIGIQQQIEQRMGFKPEGAPGGSTPND